MPAGEQLLTSSSEAVQGSTTEKTFCSRMRRAMSCVYCAPKSRMTMDWLRMDWISTDEFLKSHGLCKALRRRGCRGVAGNVFTTEHQIIKETELLLSRKLWKIAQDQFVTVD